MLAEYGGFITSIDIKKIYDQPSLYFDLETEVCGWVKTIRDLGTFGFISLNDGTCFSNLQIVVEKENVTNYDEIVKLNVGAAICAKGILVETKKAQQPFELKALSVVVEGRSTPDYPLQKKRHSMEFLREMGHLRGRTNTFLAVFHVRSAAAIAIHNFFNDRGFFYIHTPIITCSDCEGAGEMFKVTAMDIQSPPMKTNKMVDFTQDFFSKPAYLTVSGQLNAESFALCLKKVYTFGPTFRAENSNTTRHAAEFWMVEPEMAFADLKDDMSLAQDMIKYVIRYVMEKCPEEIAFFAQFFDKGLTERLNNVVNSDFAHITYTEAIDILQKNQAKFTYPVKWGSDLQTEHERYLAEKVYQKPVFVTDYPKEIKAFYMRLNDDNKTVAAMDLLVPGVGEIIGGSQREERLDVLKKRLEDCGLRLSDYDWYCDLRKYGGTRHAGFGLGFERLIMYMTGIQNIRDVIPFPRTVGNAGF